MTSLKAFAPVIADIFGVTKDSTYARQRQLVAAGVFPAPRGRGRGYGLDATPDTVSMMVLAFLLTDSLVETGKNVQRLADLPLLAGGHSRCELTAARTFYEAMVRILADRAIAEKCTQIDVNRQLFRGFIHFFKRKKPKARDDVGISAFGLNNQLPGFFVKSTIEGRSLQLLAKALEDQ